MLENSKYNDGVQLSMDLGLDMQVEELAMEPTLLISPNLLIVGFVRNGRLLRSAGTTVKAEQIELDFVKITKPGEKAFYVKLGPNVRWMEGN